MSKGKKDEDERRMDAALRRSEDHVEAEIETDTVVGWRFFDHDGERVRSRNGAVGPCSCVARAGNGSCASGATPSAGPTRSLVWPLPKDGEPGAWVDHVGSVEMCRSGLHASPTVYDALQERQGTVLGLVEADAPEATNADATKFASRRMRIVRLYERNHLVGLAAWASILALPIYEKRQESGAPRKCVETVVRWLDGKATIEEVWAAKSDACAAAAAAAANAVYPAYAYAADAVVYAAFYAAANAASANAVAVDAARSEIVADLNAGAEELLALPVEMLATWLAAKCEVSR